MTTSIQLLSIRDVVARTSLSRATIYRLISSGGDFPKPVQVTAKRVAWPSDAVDAFIASKIAGKR